MPLYRIHRMKETPRLAFRSAAHAAGLAMLKPKDFELAGDVDATSPYGAWAALHGTAGALLVGDVLEHPDGSLCVYKYVGFEEARWILPEVRTGLESVPLAAGPASQGPLPSA